LAGLPLYQESRCSHRQSRKPPEPLDTAVSALTTRPWEYLRDLADQPANALAHHLAAALLGAATGAEGAEDDSLLSAAEDLKAASDTPVPADVPDLCRRVAAMPGVDLSRLIAGLAQDPQAMRRTLEELIRRARGLR
jgi:hypothetical protein